jgi:hypothetical protein
MCLIFKLCMFYYLMIVKEILSKIFGILNNSENIVESFLSYVFLLY